MSRRALAVLAVLGAGCNNAELSKARFAPTLDQTGACALARDYYSTVEQLDLAQKACTGTVSGDAQAARLDGYTVQPVGRAYANTVSLCLVRGYRWMVLREVHEGEKCAAPEGISTTRIDSELALRAVENGVRSTERQRRQARLDDAALKAAETKLDALVSALKRRSHHESICRDVAFSPSAVDVPYFELETLLGPPPKEKDPWWFMTTLDVDKSPVALAAVPQMLVFAAEPELTEWPVVLPHGRATEGRYRGWAMLVDTQTATVQCETELELRQTATLAELKEAVRKELVDQDEQEATARLDAMALQSFATARTRENMDREGEETLKWAEQARAKKKADEHAPVPDAAAYRFGLAREFVARAPKTMRYLTEGRLKLQLVP